MLGKLLMPLAWVGSVFLSSDLIVAPMVMNQRN